MDKNKKPVNKQLIDLNNGLKVAAVGSLIVALFFTVWEIIFITQVARSRYFGQDIGYGLFSIFTFFWKTALFLASLFFFYKIASIKQKNRYYYFSLIALALFLITLIIPMFFWISCIGCGAQPNYNEPYPYG